MNIIVSSYVCARLQSYVREQLLATVAVIVKRARLDPQSDNSSNTELFSNIGQLVSSGDLSLVGHQVLLSHLHYTTVNALVVIWS